MVLHHDTLFGIDTDELFGYTTKKVVWIRDRWIGVLYYTMIFFVINWVLVGQIFWRNEQFLLKDVKGLPRMWAAHPTYKGCDPVESDCKSDYRALDELSYCQEFRGEGEGRNKAPCRYEDITTTTKEGEIDNKLFFPLSVELITEKRMCDPKAENGFECENEYQEIPGSDCMKGKRLCRTRDGKNRQFYYVADVKNFQVQFTSSYEQGDVHGTSLDHPGMLAICKSMLRKPNTTRNWAARLESTHENACSEGTEDMVAIPCAAGVDCARHDEFNVIEHTGVEEGMEAAGIEEGMESAGIDQAERDKDPDAAGDSGASLLELGSVGAPPDELHRAQILERAHERVSKRQARRHSRHRANVQSHDALHAASPQTDQSPIKVHQRDAGHSLTVSPNSGPATSGRLHNFIARHLNQGGRYVSAEEEKDDEEEDGEDPANLGKSSTLPEYTSPWGDIFKIGRLLQLAGANIDADYNFDGWTSRQAGTVLEVRAKYNNLYPILSSFGYKQVEYHYEVTELPLPYMSITMLAQEQPADFPETRVYEVRHGVLVWFKVSGTFGVFNIVYLLLMLVTAFALFTTASAVTDFVSLYLHPRKQNFFHLKYEVSPDFSDMWKCEVCGWFNWDTDLICTGVPAWQCPHTTEKCRAKRPGSEPASSRRHSVA